MRNWTGRENLYKGIPKTERGATGSLLLSVSAAVDAVVVVIVVVGAASDDVDEDEEEGEWCEDDAILHGPPVKTGDTEDLGRRSCGSCWAAMFSERLDDHLSLGPSLAIQVYKSTLTHLLQITFFNSLFAPLKLFFSIAKTTRMPQTRLGGPPFLCIHPIILLCWMCVRYV